MKMLSQLGTDQQGDKLLELLEWLFATKKDKLSEEEAQNIGVISFYKEWEKIH